jgi:hypothetical protein
MQIPGLKSSSKREIFLVITKVTITQQRAASGPLFV